MWTNMVQYGLCDQLKNLTVTDKKYYFRKMLFTQQQYTKAFYALLRAKPQKFEKSFFRDYDAVLENLHLLGYSPFDEKLIVGILNAIKPHVANRKRFKKKLIIKFLKVHMKKRPANKIVRVETSNLLFYFYQAYILDSNEETANDLNVIIKGLELSDECLEWLIENAERSNFILNRILRYPSKSKTIANWANQCFDQNMFSNRHSELVSYLVDFSEDYDLKKVDDQVLAWAIYYSRIENPAKEKYLEAILSNENVDSIIEISERLKFPNLLQKILDL